MITCRSLLSTFCLCVFTSVPIFTLAKGAVAEDIITQQAIKKNEYPPEVNQNFMKECEINGSRRYCTCFFDVLQTKYTIEQFAELEEKIATSSEIQKEFERIAESCIQSK